MNNNDYNNLRTLVGNMTEQTLNSILSFRDEVNEELSGRIEKKIRDIPLHLEKKKFELESLNEDINARFNNMGYDAYKILGRAMDEVLDKIKAVDKKDTSYNDKIEGIILDYNYNMTVEMNNWMGRFSEHKNDYIKIMDEIFNKSLYNEKCVGTIKRAIGVKCHEKTSGIRNLTKFANSSQKNTKGLEIQM